MSRPLQALTFSRYRCFRDLQQLELGRLTLVYGENNAGKSAVVRLPALLADSQQQGNRGLNASSELLRGGSVRDVQWRGKLADDESPDTTVALTLEGTEWAWVLEWKDLDRRLDVAELRVRSTEGADATEATDVSASLAGMLPSGVLADDIQPRRDVLTALLRSVTWLSTRRVGPSHAVPVGRTGRLWGDGAMAEGAVLASTALLERVSRFYRNHTDRSVRKETRGPGLETLVLEAVHDAAPPATFPESGSGLEYMFSVVAAAELLREEGGLLIVEEPEAHLHPRLQRALAEHLVGVLVETPNAQLLLETHSEVFLTAALETAIPLESALGPKEVALFWCELAGGGAARVTRVLLDDNGRPETPHLEHAFDTMGAMRRELLKKRRAHAG